MRRVSRRRWSAPSVRTPMPRPHPSLPTACGGGFAHPMAVPTRGRCRYPRYTARWPAGRLPSAAAGRVPGCRPAGRCVHPMPRRRARPRTPPSTSRPHMPASAAAPRAPSNAAAPRAPSNAAARRLLSNAAGLCNLPWRHTRAGRWPGTSGSVPDPTLRFSRRSCELRGGASHRNVRDAVLDVLVAAHGEAESLVPTAQV